MRFSPASGTPTAFNANILMLQRPILTLAVLLLNVRDGVNYFAADRTISAFDKYIKI